MATMAAWRPAAMGSTSGVGLAMAKTIASSAIVAMSSPVRMLPEETPMSTSAPASASLSDPWKPRGLVFCASQLRWGLASSRKGPRAPLRPQPMTSVAPWSMRRRMIAEPAAPTPETTIRASSMRLPTSLRALMSAERVTIAVPC